MTQENKADETKQPAASEPQANTPEEVQSASAPASGDASEAAPEPAQDEMAELLKQLAALQEELQLRKDEVLRGRAELENYRKRMQREREEIRKTATAGLIEDLLPLLDNLKLGLQSAEQHPEAKVVTEGFAMVLSMFQNTLASHGLKEVNPKGEPFDPNFHDGVSQQPSEEIKEDHVIEVIRAGYLLGERLVRPATVVVSSGKPSSESAEKSSEASSPSEG